MPDLVEEDDAVDEKKKALHKRFNPDREGTDIFRKSEHEKNKSVHESLGSDQEGKGLLLKSAVGDVVRSETCEEEAAPSPEDQDDDGQNNPLHSPGEAEFLKGDEAPAEDALQPAELDNFHLLEILLHDEREVRLGLVKNDM